MFAVVPLLLALSWGGRDYPWGSFEVLSLLTTATVMGAVFLFAQARTPHAILPPSLFRHRVVRLFFRDKDSPKTHAVLLDLTTERPLDADYRPIRRP